MSVVNTIDEITAWAQKEICDSVLLKLPKEGTDDHRYNEQYELVHPIAYPFYLPSKEGTAPQFEGPVPGLCVQLVNGKDMRLTGTLKVGFLFATWNPGVHGKDIFRPEGGGLFTQWSDSEAMAYYKRAQEGWRDAYNFVDTALHALGSTERIGDVRIDHEAGTEYGPLTIEDSVPILYPYWYAWLTFTAERRSSGINPDIEKFL
jgi:hypothetical protein